jgi:hypothetical protein
MANNEQIDPYYPPERPEEKAAANVFELLDRILDKGLVIIGDIRISVADIELLKLQIRLLIASVETAKQMGIDFSWAKAVEAPKSKDQLKEHIRLLEEKLQGHQTAKGPTNPESSLNDSNEDSYPKDSRNPATPNQTNSPNQPNSPNPTNPPNPQY